MTDPTAKTDLQARYDRLAAAELAGEGTYETLTAAKRYFRARKLAAALELGGFPPGARLLEIGCNVGQFSFPLAEAGYEVTGLDLSANAIAVARRRAAQSGGPPAAFVVGDAEDLGAFSADAFDGVVSFSTLRYVPNLPRALEAIRRVLKPGGRMVADFPNRYCPWFYVKQWLGSEVHPHDHVFTTAQLNRLYRAAGLIPLQVHPLLFTPTVAPDAALPAFRRLDRIGERLPLVRRLAGILMVVAAKQ